MTIQNLLIKSQRKLKNISSSAQLDAEILMLEVLKNGQSNRAWLYANPNHQLKKLQTNEFQRLLARRLKGEPIAYIIGHKEFYSLDFFVNRNVLIPRPETEVLVEAVIKHIGHQKLTVADIGTGSGCIAIAIAKNCPEAKIKAFDISKNALLVAQKNARHNKVLKKISFEKGDLIPWQKQSFNVIVANLPYLDDDFSNLLDSSDTRGIKFEPKLAWAGGKDGLDIYRRLFENIPTQYCGAIFIEADPNQIMKLKRIARQKLDNPSFEIIKDYSKVGRFLKIQTTCPSDPKSN